MNMDEEITIDDFNSMKETNDACYAVNFGQLLPFGQCYIPNYKVTDSVTVNGKQYKRTERCEAVIDYEAGDDAVPVYILRDGKVQTIRRQLKRKVFGFAPFFSITAIFDPEIVLPFEGVTKKGYQLRYASEKNVERAICEGVAWTQELEIVHGNMNIQPDLRQNPVTFYHAALTWGYNNVISLAYRFDNLLNMDVRECDKDDVERLSAECRRTKVLEKCLNFDVFTRTLTDEEKIKCAADFLNICINTDNNATSKH